MNDLRGATALWLLLALSPCAFGKMTPEQIQSLPPPASRTVVFSKDIKLIFDSSCIKCHGRGREKGGFRIDHRETLLKGGDSGPAIVPGNPRASMLLIALRHEGQLQMPPGPKLPSKEIAILTRWIERGAV